MYIVRYASQFPEGQEICITLQQAPLGKGSVDFFPAEGVSRNTLVKLGDCVVIRVKGDTGALLVTEYHMAARQEREVNLRIDRIDTSEALLELDRRSAAAAAPARPMPAAAPAASRLQAAPSPLAPAPMPARVPTASDGASPIRLEFEGHIERRGDVRVEGGWLGNPDGTARLEGFIVHWPEKPQGVDLAYSCRVQGQGKQPAALSGRYAGTRRQALGITAVTFGLVGPQQKLYRLAGQAVFSGYPPQDVLNGQEVSSPSGHEHLVALKLSVSPKSEANAPRYQSPWEDPAITKIYKAQG
ncbi:hypothetical protein FOZ76_06090 [Verticiella sediminum]|uniref:Uncharacterized protein n=2 Tax=Verticiella sediminum TaxID=1247510 RepID=A0A556AWW2_9BURK|nr:hypothetical protein FOZ76_06090 [Verticiella sediminum]